ncbi:sigma-70 family RNA polymerase sigma factor [Streptomyces collinus]
MIAITIEQIRSAADKTAADHLTAFAAVMDAFGQRIGQLANKYSTNGTRNHDLAEELEQEGRIAVWQCIERFQGESVAQFFTYVDRTLKGVMDDKRRTETRQGVSEDTARRFEQCLTVCAGDPYEAEREATRPDGCLGKWRLSADMAYAARLAWLGSAYLDAPSKGEHGDDMPTLADRLSRDGFLSVSVDLADPSDVERGRRAAIKAAVHATLARMGRQQRYVLSADYGIDPVAPLDNDREIAEALEVAETRITVIRWKGKERFRELYLKGENVATVAA